MKTVKDVEYGRALLGSVVEETARLTSFAVVLGRACELVTQATMTEDVEPLEAAHMFLEQARALERELDPLKTLVGNLVLHRRWLKLEGTT